MQSQTRVVDFGALHHKVKLNYEIDLERLPKVLKPYKSTLEQFTNEELLYLRWRMVWKSMAREKQLPPKEFDQMLKDIWVTISGRGFGKTLLGSNWLGIEAASFSSMYCCVAPTKDDVRYTCFEGPTGLYSVIPKQLIIDKNLALPSITIWAGANAYSNIRGFAGDSPERLRGPQHAKAWCDEIACLVAGTLVRTARGNVPIENVKVGDAVWTRSGLRCVLAGGVSSRSAALWEMTASDGSKLVGTGHHPVWTDVAGFVPLQALRHGTILSTWQTSSFGRECGGFGGESVSRIEEVKRSIEQSMNSIEGRFRKGIPSKSIIETVTHATTTFRIWLQSLIPNTRNSIRKDSFFGTLNELLVSAARNGNKRNLDELSARCVARATSLLDSGLNSVLKSAETLHTAIREQSTSVVSVKELGRQDVVYNLDVEEAHEFYANGILTHNSWMYADDAWSNLMFGLRLGPHPQVAVTGTPKPSQFIRDLTKRKDAIVVRGSTYENRENLTPAYFNQVDQYKGTKIWRQEALGEILDPEEGGIVKRSWWRMWPADRPLPRFQYIVMSVDTAFSEEEYDKKKKENDPTACSVWGLFLHKVKPEKPPIKCLLLLDAWEEMLGFPELIKTIKRVRQRRYGAHIQGDQLLPPPRIPSRQLPGPQGKKIDLLLIESKGSGISLLQTLENEDIFGEPYNPGKLDKLQRLHVVSLLWTHGRVWAVESDKVPGQFRNWAEPLISQVCSYMGEGSIRKDDLLDTTTQALRYFFDHHIGTLTVPKDPEEEKRKAAIAARARLVKREGYG